MKTADQASSPRIIYFVTSNKNKLAEIQSMLGGEEGIRIEGVDIDMPEIQAEKEEISRHKTNWAYKQVGKAVLVEDTSLCFDALGGLPGPFVKWFSSKLPQGIHTMLAGFEDKNAQAVTIYGFKESADSEPLLFIGKTEGKIVPPRGKAKFGWDACFEENISGLTYAQMDVETKNACSQRGKAFRSFLKYFQSTERHP